MTVPEDQGSAMREHGPERLACLKACLNGTDGEAAQAVAALVRVGGAAAVNDRIVLPSCETASPAVRTASDAAARLGLSHARSRAPFPVPVALRPTPAFVVPRVSAKAELSGLLCTPGNTLLHLCAARGLARATEALIAGGARCDLFNAANETALDLARLFLSTHATDATIHLLEGRPCAPPAALPSWTDAWIALRDASDEDAAKIVERILEFGVDAEHPVGITAEQAKAEKEMRSRINRKQGGQHWDTVRQVLLATKRIPSTEKRQRDRTFVASSRRCEEREWFDFAGGTAGFTLLHLACAKDKPLCCSLLLRAGADPNVPAIPAHAARDEATPYSIALDAGHRRCVEAIVLSLRGRGLPPPPSRHHRPSTADFAPPAAPATRAQTMQASQAMRVALAHDAHAGEPLTWTFLWDDVRDASDVVAALTLRTYLAQAHQAECDPLLDKKRLDGYGRDAGRTLAHLAASRGKVETLAVLRDAGASMGVPDLDGFTPLQLVAAAPRTIFDAPLAAEVGIDLRVLRAAEARPAPFAEHSVDPMTAWDRAYAGIRDAVTEADALAAIGPLVALDQGADAYGRTAAHRADCSPHSPLSLALERNFRDVLLRLQTSLAARHQQTTRTRPPPSFGATTTTTPPPRHGYYPGCDAPKQPLNCPRFQRFGLEPKGHHWMQHPSNTGDARKPTPTTDFRR